MSHFIMAREFSIFWNPAMCLCDLPLPKGELYCIYCNEVCSLVLEDYECGVGYWQEFGRNGGCSISWISDDFSKFSSLLH